MQKRLLFLIGITAVIVTTSVFLLGAEILGSQLPGIDEFKISKTGEISYKIF